MDGRRKSLSRRDLMKSLASVPLASGVLPLAAPTVRAQGWPSGNITLIVPFPPGGQADLAARPIAEALQKILGATVVVENRAGARMGHQHTRSTIRLEHDPRELDRRSAQHLHPGFCTAVVTLRNASHEPIAHLGRAAIEHHDSSALVLVDDQARRTKQGPVFHRQPVPHP